jgi:hypothetical protein
MKTPIVHCKSGNYVESWYDRSTRSWITLTKDGADCQIGEADYDGHPDSRDCSRRLRINAEGGELRESVCTVPKLRELDALILWPKGTVGEENERRAVAALLQLCKEFGFGRVPQLAKQIYDVWSSPETVCELSRVKRKHLREMERLRAQYERTR